MKDKWTFIRVWSSTRLNWDPLQQWQFIAIQMWDRPDLDALRKYLRIVPRYHPLISHSRNGNMNSLGAGGLLMCRTTDFWIDAL